MNEATLEVVGSGACFEIADEVCFTLFLEAKGQTYQETMLRGQGKLAILQRTCEEMGFVASDLKTIALTMEEDYEQVKNEQGLFTSVFLGYQLRHQLELCFRLDFISVSEVVQALSTTLAYPEFSLHYRLNRETETKVYQQALNQALERAKNDAMSLAVAGGYRLGDIILIQAKEQEDNFIPQLLKMDTLSSNLLKNISISPKEMMLTAHVRTVWTLAEMKN